MVSEEGAEGRGNDEEGRSLGEPDAPRDPNAPPPGSIRELILASAPKQPPRAAQDEEEEGPSTARRALALAIVAGAVLLTFLVLTSGDPYKVTASFANASQLVEGNGVVVGGSRVGSVDSIELGDEGEAEVTFSVSDQYAPLQRGTIATVRSPALSTIAGREVELTLPPASSGADEIPDGGEMSQSETVSEVDLDQVFNSLDPKTIRDFKHVIQGFETSYEGIGEQANRGLRYLNPFLSTSRRVFSELSADQRAFENLIVDTSQLSGALADRAPDVSGLVANLNSMMNAIGDRKERLAQAVSLLPDFMRQTNTTFVNLRAALDDLDPLVSAAKPAARELRPFLSELRAAADDAVPTVSGLDRVAERPGAANDLTDLVGVQPALAEVGVGSGSPECGPGPENPADLQVAADDDYTQGALGETACALRNSQPALSMFRAYTPELVGWFNDFSGSSGFQDAYGGGVRIAVTLNPFTLSLPGSIPDLLDPLTPDEFVASIDKDNTRKCPGANERPADDLGDHSVPFTDGGALTDGVPGDCDPSQLIPGP